MRWIRSLLRSEEDDVHAHVGETPSSAASASDETGSDETGADVSVDAERPVDLATLDVAGATPGLLEISHQVRRMALAAERERERPYLAELSRRLRRGEIRLPPMPEAVLRVQRLIDSGSCHIAQLAREIERDPALATRLVGIANSPFYQGLGAVPSVSDAVTRIGLGETRNIVLAVMLRSKVFRVPGRSAEVRRLWQHSVAASISAQVLGAAAGVDPDAAFITGLLHDLGRVLLLSLGAEVERAVKGAPLDAETVRRAGALLHARLGAVAAESWGVAPPIVHAILHHHDPAQACEDDRRFAYVVRAADLLAQRIADERRASDGTSALLWSGALDALDLNHDLAHEVEAEAREALRTRAAEL
jgi:HD-like signal output (HDOD) protein